MDKVKGRINAIKSSKNKRFMIIEIVKDHIYGVAELKTIEYLYFKFDDLTLHRSKIVLHLDKSVPHNFDISDEI